jgi:hypothetical protein
MDGAMTHIEFDIGQSSPRRGQVAQSARNPAAFFLCRVLDSIRLQ